MNTMMGSLNTSKKYIQGSVNLGRFVLATDHSSKRQIIFNTRNRKILIKSKKVFDQKLSHYMNLQERLARNNQVRYYSLRLNAIKFSQQFGDLNLLYNYTDCKFNHFYQFDFVSRKNVELKVESSHTEFFAYNHMISSFFLPKSVALTFTINPDYESVLISKLLIDQSEQKYNLQNENIINLREVVSRLPNDMKKSLSKFQNIECKFVANSEDLNEIFTCLEIGHKLAFFSKIEIYKKQNKEKISRMNLSKSYAIVIIFTDKSGNYIESTIISSSLKQDDIEIKACHKMKSIFIINEAGVEVIKVSD